MNQTLYTSTISTAEAVETKTDVEKPPQKNQAKPPKPKTTREDRISIAKKLVRAKELCLPVVKDKKAHQFSYATPAQATANGSNACTAAGLAAIGKVQVIDQTTVRYRLKLIDQDTGHFVKFSSPLVPLAQKGRDPAHAIRTATTYAEKIVWCAALTIPQFTDQDAADAQAEAAAEIALYNVDKGPQAQQASNPPPARDSDSVGSGQGQAPAISSTDDLKKSLGIAKKTKTKSKSKKAPKKAADNSPAWDEAQQAQRAIKEEAYAVLNKPQAEILFKGLVLAKDAPETWSATIEEAKERLTAAKTKKTK